MSLKDCKIVTLPLCPTHTPCSVFHAIEPCTTNDMDMYKQQRELKRHWRVAAIERRKRTSADQRREAGRLLAEHALERR